MKTLYFNRLLLFVFVALVGFGCSKDKDEVKPVDKLLGSYDVLVIMTSSEDHYEQYPSEATISKGNNEDIIIKVGSMQFSGNQVKSLEGGIEFNIPSQPIKLDDLNLIASGEGGVSESLLVLTISLTKPWEDGYIDLDIMGEKK